MAIAYHIAITTFITITNITEGYASQRDLSIGLDNGRYPLPRTVIFGVNLEF